ncbi:alpha/beta hydrolase [Branchiibius cervicis]|uniref:Alpha/beta hydrolase n=1 Tax=Branchiibius cervicis TaxID=908252 RepID=A0ABW2AWE6_9MICO
MVTFTILPGSPFGPQSLPHGVEPVRFETEVGPLTGLHAAPVGSDHGTVLLIPGFTGSKEDFLDFMPLLASAGYDTWAYSQRGQADSAAPEGQQCYTLDAFTADAMSVAQLVARQGRPLHLVGHSFGGVVAREAAIDSPTDSRP